MIRKENTVLIGDRYNTPKTSLIIFHFEPNPNEELKPCVVHYASIEKKDLYIIDNYFQKNARDGTRNYFENASYSRFSYSTADSYKNGEKPGFSMNTKERWKLFLNPPPSIDGLHKFLSLLSSRLNAEITTAPWELSCQEDSVTPSVIVNFHTEVSNATMLLGKHRDCDPAKGMYYGIPVLYQEKGAFHDNCFENGAPGKPWLVSMMLYAASEHLLAEHRMGTVFYKTDGEMAVKTNCLDSRFVFFEGDLFHSVEESNIPPDLELWRVSYVLKLVINPRDRDQSVKEMFAQFMRSQSFPVHELTPGSSVRV